MTAHVARLVGGAGTGKTTELIRILEKVLAKGTDPLEVGFVSFTKAARREASTRASDLTGVPVSVLEQDGWFRTIHSICFKALEASRSNMVSEDSKADRKWLAESLGASIGNPTGEDIANIGTGGKTEAQAALDIWDSARNRLLSVREAYCVASRTSGELPGEQYCEDIANRYEQAKRLDNRLDFVDLLGKFAGWNFDVAGHEETTPEGICPTLPVWIFDEQQDTSALLHAVCHRLAASATWVYLAGDPFQAIYGFQGSHARFFMEDWQVDKARVMPQSYRCAPAIHEFGEKLLRRCSDYWDRGIKPASHEGSVEFLENGRDIEFPSIDPRDSWLLIARTRYQAGRLISAVKDMGIPWQPTSGLGGWAQPKKNGALNALFDAYTGYPISGSEWMLVLEQIPQLYNGEKLLVRGTKAEWLREGGDRAKLVCYVDQLVDWGATELLVENIKGGTWPNFFIGGSDYAKDYLTARERYGYEVVTDPPVKAGTIHSVKGAEADNVVWLTTTNRMIHEASEDDQEFYNEECRIAYVAATRARKRLYVMDDSDSFTRYRFEV